MGSGDEVVNHITTVGDDGRLISVMPFDRELGNTVYVPDPLCVAAADGIQLVKDVFEQCASRQQFKQRLAALNVPRPERGVDIVVLRLNFAQNTIIQL